MLHFLGFDSKENIQIFSTQVVITLKLFNSVLFFFFFALGFPSSPHSFIFKAFVQYKMTRAELFFKREFEVCLLNKLFAVIIRLRIKVQTHLMLEVTENCYHLMAVWAALSQTAPHAPRPGSGHCPGQGQGPGQHSDRAFPRVASWVINLTVSVLWP